MSVHNLLIAHPGHQHYNLDNGKKTPAHIKAKELLEVLSPLSVESPKSNSEPIKLEEPVLSINNPQRTSSSAEITRRGSVSEPTSSIVINATEETAIPHEIQTISPPVRNVSANVVENVLPRTAGARETIQIIPNENVEAQVDIRPMNQSVRPIVLNTIEETAIPHEIQTISLPVRNVSENIVENVLPRTIDARETIQVIPNENVEGHVDIRPMSQSVRPIVINATEETAIPHEIQTISLPVRNVSEIIENLLPRTTVARETIQVIPENIENHPSAIVERTTPPSQFIRMETPSSHTASTIRENIPTEQHRVEIPRPIAEDAFNPVLTLQQGQMERERTLEDVDLQSTPYVDWDLKEILEETQPITTLVTLPTSALATDNLKAEPPLRILFHNDTVSEGILEETRNRLPKNQTALHLNLKDLDHNAITLLRKEFASLIKDPHAVVLDLSYLPQKETNILQRYLKTHYPEARVVQTPLALSHGSAFSTSIKNDSSTRIKALEYPLQHPVNMGQVVPIEKIENFTSFSNIVDIIAPTSQESDNIKSAQNSRAAEPALPIITISPSLKQIHDHSLHLSSQIVSPHESEISAPNEERGEVLKIEPQPQHQITFHLDSPSEERLEETSKHIKKNQMITHLNLKELNSETSGQNPEAVLLETLTFLTKDSQASFDFSYLPPKETNSLKSFIEFYYPEAKIVGAPSSQRSDSPSTPTKGDSPIKYMTGPEAWSDLSPSPIKDQPRHEVLQENSPVSPINYVTGPEAWGDITPPSSKSKKSDKENKNPVESTSPINYVTGPEAWGDITPPSSKSKKSDKENKSPVESTSPINYVTGPEAWGDITPPSSKSKKSDKENKSSAKPISPINYLTGPNAWEDISPPSSKNKKSDKEKKSPEKSTSKERSQKLPEKFILRNLLNEFNK